MCKLALLVLFVNFVANSAIIQVLKEQIIGGPDGLLSVHEIETETAFVDMYGDFEEMVHKHRNEFDADIGSILHVARAQEFTDFKFRTYTTFEMPDSIRTMSDKKIALVKATTAEMDNMNGKMRKAGQKDDEDFFTDYHLMVNPQGYIEEFYKTQRCYR